MRGKDTKFFLKAHVVRSFFYEKAIFLTVFLRHILTKSCKKKYQPFLSLPYAGRACSVEEAEEPQGNDSVSRPFE